MFANLTEETCIGTGDVLTHTGATAGHRPFSRGFDDGQPVAYVVKDSGGVITCSGVGTYDATANATTRNDTENDNGTITDKNPATNITLSAGTHTISCDISVAGIYRGVATLIQNADNTWPARPAGYVAVNWYGSSDPVINANLYPNDRWLVAGAASEGYDIILLVGQSNMVGWYGPIDVLLDATNDKVFQYPKTDGVIALAADPLDHWNEVADTIGLGLSFGKDLLHNTLPTRNVLLIPAASGATGFTSGEWVDGGAEHEYAISAANAAIALETGNKLVGVLWHQGESDAALTEAAYAAHLDTLISLFRTEITGATNIPFIVGQVPSWSTFYGAGVDAALLATPARVANTAVVLTSDLTHGGDSLHFNATSLRTLGERYSWELKRLTVPESLAVGHWVFGLDNESMTDLVAGDTLTQNNVASIPVHSEGFLALPTGTLIGLNSSIAETDSQTVIAVVRASDISTGGIFAGTFAAGNGAGIYHNAADVAYTRNPASPTTFATLDADTWVFVAITTNNNGADYTAAAFVGNSATPVYHSQTLASVVLSASSISIGASYYDSAIFRAAMDCAELIVINSALSQAGLQEVYDRSVTRLASRGVALI